MHEPNLNSALVRLLANDQTPRKPVGAGFLVSDRHILTCAHVVDDALGGAPHLAPPEDSIPLDFPLIENHPMIRARVVKWHPVREAPVIGELDDIAVLELVPGTSLPPKAASVPMAPPQNEFFERPVRMCGFPEGMDNGDWVKGELRGVTGEGWVQFDQELGRRGVAPGFSGTAVWDKRENAVSGMVVSVNSRDGQTSAYMIPTAALIKAFPELERQKIKEPDFDTAPPRSLTPKEIKIRSRYLKNIRRHVENLWKESIHNARFLDLGIADTPIATHLPWMYKNPGDTREFTDIDQAFQAYDQRMLLLGAPGAGKTTTLLHIARKMIADVEKDSSAPIPLIVNLSKFQFESTEPSILSRLAPTRKNPAARDRSFEAWLVGEFTALPGVPRSTARQWAAEGRMAVLLDGLDEVNVEFRADLLKLLNDTYLKDHPDSPVLVCSRIDEYQPLQERKDTRLQLPGAVTLQPLSRVNIEAYLKAARASALNEALGKDASLYELARTPLTLSMMTLAYAGLPAAEIPTFSSIVDQRHHLMKSFVSRMLQRKERRDRNIPFDEDKDKDVPTREYKYRPDRLNRHLSWLAVHLSVRMQTSCSLDKFYSFIRRETSGKKNVLDGWVIRLSRAALLSLFMVIICMPILPLDAGSVLLAMGAIGAVCGSFMTFSAALDRWKDVLWFWVFMVGPALVFAAVSFGVISRTLSLVVPIRMAPMAIGIIALTSSIAIMTTIIVSVERDWKRPWLIPAMTLVGLFIGLSSVYWRVDAVSSDWIMAAAMAAMQMISFIVLIHRNDMDRREAWGLSAIVIGIVVIIVACQAGGVFLVGSLHWIVVLIFIGTTLFLFFTLSKKPSASLAALALFSTAGGFFADREGAVLGTIFFLIIYLFSLLVIDYHSGEHAGFMSRVGFFLKRFVEEVEKRTEKWIMSPASLALFFVSRCLPLGLRGFLRYGGQSLILKPFSGEIEFVHRRLRDY
ncbi:MAG: NACHT domain-containing protein, partial [Desulfobacterales bacterium]|nr:NACHT domain-containing protein [Desulfobacterales bacterium]